jgi:hypothetical protein
MPWLNQETNLMFLNLNRGSFEFLLPYQTMHIFLSIGLLFLKIGKKIATFIFSGNFD